MMASESAEIVHRQYHGRLSRRWRCRGTGRRADFDKYLAAVPDVAPPENDRLH